MVYTLSFFLFKMQFHNSNVFGSCIIHISYTRCAKTKKIIPAPKGYKFCSVLIFYVLLSEIHSETLVPPVLPINCTYKGLLLHLINLSQTSYSL